MSMEDKILYNAMEISKKENRLAYTLTKYLVPKKMQKMAFLTYYFLRWVDDTIDNVNFPKKDKLRFLRNEKKLVKNIFSNKKIANLNKYEAGILLMKNIDRKIALKMKNYVLDNYFMAFELELRRPKTVTKKWLSRYAYHVGGSFANIGILVLNPNVDKRIINGVSKTAASASDMAHFLRDFRKDVKNQQINIAREDLEKFRINTNSLTENSQELRNFAKNQLNEIHSLFSRGEKYIKAMPSLKLKLAASLFVSKYKFVLEKIKYRNYNLFSNYEDETFSEKILKIRMIFNDIIKLAF